MGAAPAVSSGESPPTSAAGSAATTVHRGPRRCPRRCGRSGVNLLMDSPGQSGDARAQPASPDAGYRGEIQPPPRASRQPRATEGSPQPGFSFQNNHGGGSINPIFQRGKRRRGETVPDGKWFWPAWDSDTRSLRPFWYRHSPRSRTGAKSSGSGGRAGLRPSGGRQRPVAGKQNSECREGPLVPCGLETSLLLCRLQGRLPDPHVPPPRRG